MKAEASSPQSNPSEPFNEQTAIEHLNKEIGNCKKCNNRRFIGFNLTYKKPVYCTCFIKYMSKMRFVSLQKNPSDETLSKVQ